jgi:hypothetical protein
LKIEVALVLLMLIPIGIASEGNMPPDGILGGNGTVVNAWSASYLTPSPIDVTPDKVMTDPAYWSRKLADTVHMNDPNEELELCLEEFFSLYKKAAENNLTEYEMSLLKTQLEEWKMYFSEISDAVNSDVIDINSDKFQTSKEFFGWMFCDEINKKIWNDLSKRDEDFGKFGAMCPSGTTPEKVIIGLSKGHD